MKTLYAFITLFIFTSVTHAQYFENFSTPDQGILAGPCGSNDPASCVNYDFSGVDWTITGDLSGLDSDNGGENFKTTGGVLTTLGDIDEEICWVSPLLDISSGVQNFSVAVSYTGFDNTDYLDVEYSVDGGAWNIVNPTPNINGDLHTINGMSGGGLTGSATISESGINGSTMQIRVCADFNTSSENFTADDVSAPNANIVVLPVKLQNFDAVLNNNQTELSWSTLTEENNDYFSIERSTDGKHFEEIAQLEGANHSTELIEYEYTDRAPLAGDNYYRLKQLDYDGRFAYSSVQSVSLNSNENLIDDFKLFPNPVNIGEPITFDLTSQINEAVVILLTDMKGAIIQAYEKNIVAGQNSISLRTDHLNKGIYLMSCTSAQTNYTQKIIVKSN